MASITQKQLANGTKKRKRGEELNEKPLLGQETILDLGSDGEKAEEDDEEDDGEYEPFPELDTGSLDSSEPELDEEDEEDEDDEETDSENEATTEEELDIFEKARQDAKIGMEGRTVISDLTGRPKRVYPEIEPEYDSDSSTEEAPNRVGNIPSHWYDDLPHIGYDIEGKKVLRPAKGDELDKFLATVENPESWTSAYDKNLQTDKPLSMEELDIIQRLYKGENPDATYDPYEPTIEWFTGKGKEEIMPLSAAPEPKRRWVPSKWEKQKVMKIVRAIRQGRIVPRKPQSANEIDGSKGQFYELWTTSTSDQIHSAPIPAPKPRLPTNSESYNPPEEYLPTESEKKEWEEADKEDRERDYLPQKYSALRLVPAYADSISERFSRLLDLYMAPRVQRRKLNIDPESLIPSLPSPQSLKPFPTYLAIRESDRHSAARVRCIVTCPPTTTTTTGDWALSGDEVGRVSLWESASGHEAFRWTLKGKISSLGWCPRKDVSYFAVCTDEQVHMVIPPFVAPAVLSATKAIFDPATTPAVIINPKSASNDGTGVKWSMNNNSSSSANSGNLGFVASIELPQGSGQVQQITWHRKGDYFATVSSGTNQATAVWIHQVSKRHSQAPFKGAKGQVQKVAFHPSKPYFFVATQRHVRMYDLAGQKLVKTFITGIKWISSLAVHPSGDHFIVGGYDRKLCWFDLELSDKPYKVLRYHTRAIRSVSFHPTYPLFASSSDDGSIQVFHARVYNDLMTDPLIVPLKILRGHSVKDGLGVLDISWVEGLPWLVSAGADGRVGVWCA